MGATRASAGWYCGAKRKQISQLAQTADGGLRLAIDADPEGGQHVGAAAAAGGGARAVLGNRASGGGDDEGCGGGNIEGLHRAGAGSRGVQHLRGNCHGQHALVERIGKAGQLIRISPLATSSARAAAIWASGVSAASMASTSCAAWWRVRSRAASSTGKQLAQSERDRWICGDCLHVVRPEIPHETQMRCGEAIYFGSVAGKAKNAPELEAHDGVGPPSTGGAISAG